MEREKEGFPITSLREINTLLISQHRNVVTVREIVVGSNMDKIFIGKSKLFRCKFATTRNTMFCKFLKIIILNILKSFQSWILLNMI